MDLGQLTGRSRELTIEVGNIYDAVMMADLIMTPTWAKLIPRIQSGGNQSLDVTITRNRVAIFSFVPHVDRIWGQSRLWIAYSGHCNGSMYNPKDLSVEINDGRNWDTQWQGYAGQMGLYLHSKIVETIRKFNLGS